MIHRPTKMIHVPASPSHANEFSLSDDDVAAGGAQCRGTDGGRRGERATASPLMLAGVWCVVFVARWAYAANRNVYHLAPDEPATLGMARWLSGNGDWTMFRAATWRPGLATILAPIFWFADDPEAIYRAALVVNAAIGALGAVVLVGLVARLCCMGVTGSVLISGSVAVLPASLSASAYVWAEPLVTVTFLIATCGVLRYWDEPRLAGGLVATVAASAGMACHGRMMPFVVLVAIALVGGSIRHRRRSDGLVIVGATLVAAGCAVAYSGFVISRVWADPADTNTAGSTLARLGRPTGVLDAAAGQVWYLLTASVGVVGVGIFVLVRTARSHTVRGRDARLLLFLTVPLIIVSMVFMADRPRVDQLVYGRYNDAIVWPVFAVGMVWLLRDVRTELRRTVWWVTAVTVATTVELGLLIQQLHSDQLGRGGAEYAMVPGIRMFSGSLDQIPVLRITALASLSIAFVFAAARWRGGQPWLVGGVLGALMLAGAFSTRDLGGRLNSGESARGVLAIEDGRIPPDAVLGARFAPDVLSPNVSPWNQLNHVLLFQWYLTERTFVEDFGNDDATGPFVFAPSNEALMEISGGTIIWDDPGSNMALWREPLDG